MSEDRRQILEMLSAGKITAQEAEKLLAALESTGATVSPTAPENKARPKYLRVLVEPAGGGDNGTRVNVRIPIQLLRAGVKLAGLIPVAAREKVSEALQGHGMRVDLSRLKPEDLDELIEQMNELSVDVDDGGEKVRVFCE